MKLLQFKDYVISPNASMVMDQGVFIGTQNYFFFLPSKKESYSYNTVTTSEFSFKGKNIQEASLEIISNADSGDHLDKTLLSMSENFPEIVFYKINDLSAFKLFAGFFGSGISVRLEGKKLWTPFVQKLGKDKKAIKQFYSQHSKIK